MRITRLVRSVGAPLLCTLSLAFLLSVPAMAQPYSGWISLLGYPSYHGYVVIPDNAALNFNGYGFTFEAWVSLSNNAGVCCHSIAGKNYQNNWWVGTTFDAAGHQILRSYLGGSWMDVGVVPAGPWTHIAVVYNGSRRIHYINGEKVGERLESLSPGTGGSEMRFGSDVMWQYTPHGALNEMRLWNVPRSEAEIRYWINKQIMTPTFGLVGAWDISGNNRVGAYDGTITGTGIGAMTYPVTIFGCGSGSSTSLCLLNRFSVTMKWRTNPNPGTQPDGDAHVASCANPGSGVFYFFEPNVWEALVKVVNGCGVNNRYWVFSAATTDIFYRMEVMDTLAGINRIYFSYPGTAAQSIIDTDAIAACGP